MTDLLTPKEIKAFQGGWYSDGDVNRLCRDYLTLWEQLETVRELRELEKSS